jgi:DNA repair photolyase
MGLWYDKNAPAFDQKESKSLLHSFMVHGYRGFTINPYQGCQHRCGYCYATYEWSPEFYDKIYAKSNAPEILENQLKANRSKSKTIGPVMVSSATDAYQPAELKFELTRKCVNVLQKYAVPYYVFTKSTIILRDLNLHKQYKHNCFIVWSITTCDENIRRLIEPGTPPSSKMFETIKKFSRSGIRCGVNIDPILPLITDSSKNIESILDSCAEAGVQYVFGAILRLRLDIWERMKAIFNSLGLKNGIKEYERIFHFTEPLQSRYNVLAGSFYSDSILKKLEADVNDRGMNFDFPELIGSNCVKTNNSGGNSKQLSLMNFIK